MVLKQRMLKEKAQTVLERRPNPCPESKTRGGFAGWIEAEVPRAGARRRRSTASGREQIQLGQGQVMGPPPSL